MYTRLSAWWKDGLVLLAALLVLFLGLGATSIYIVDESRNAQAGWEMYATQEWVVPTFNAELRTDKPPLHYYGMRLGYFLWGKSAWAARFGSALCGLGVCVLLFGFADSYWGARPARWGVVLAMSSLYLPLQLRLATPDPYLIFCFTWSTLSLWRAYEKGQLIHYLQAFVALGLAVLAKGPVGPVLLAGGSLAFLFWNRTMQWSAFQRFRPIEGFLLLMLVAAPWFLAVHWRTNGAFTDGFFLEHNVQRFTATKEGHGGNPIVIPVLALVALFPVSILLPQCIAHWRAKPQPLGRFLASVVGFSFVFFALSQTKLPSYPAVVYPLVMLLMAPVLVKLAAGRYLVFTWQWMLWLFVTLAIPLGLWLGLAELGLSAATKQLAVLAVILPLTIATAWLLYQWQRRALAIQLVFGGFMVWQCLLFVGLLPQVDRQNHVQKSLPLLVERPIVAYERCTPAYVFYASEPIPVVHSRAALKAWLTQYDGTECPVVLSTHRQERTLDSFSNLQQYFRKKDLFENLTTVIYRYETESCP